MSQRLTLHVDNAGDLLDASAYALSVEAVSDLQKYF